jgi:hypothetical protein
VVQYEQVEYDEAKKYAKVRPGLGGGVLDKVQSKYV